MDSTTHVDNKLPYLFLAYATDHHRYFIPSKVNVFGGLKIDVAMLDSGCSTILLPICSSQQITEMSTLFPLQRFNWQIGGSKGVGALHSPTLMIKPLPQETKQTITVSLGQDVFTNTFELPFLRFHVCYDDAKQLNSIDRVIGKDILQKFISTVENLQKVCPSISIAERRTHALVGQAILRQPGITCFQLPSIMIVAKLATVDPSLAITALGDLDRSLAGKCLEVVRRHFVEKEFQDLADEVHDDEFYYNPSPMFYCFDE